MRAKIGSHEKYKGELLKAEIQMDVKAWPSFNENLLS